MLAHVGKIAILSLTLTLTVAPPTSEGATTKRAPAAGRNQVEPKSASPNSATPGVRYVRADTRAEAVAMLQPNLGLVQPGAVIEIPGDLSAAKYGPCWLYPHKVHTRKSGNWGTVGAKPETDCKEPVSVIRHETTVRYAWYLWWLQAGRTHVETDTNSTWFQSLELEYKCRGKGMTTRTGTTLGTIVFHGHRYYARVYHGVRDLDCEA